MKRILVPIFLTAAILLAITYKPHAQETSVTKPGFSPPVSEYASVRFMEERTSIVWPDGTVENVMDLAGRKKFENGREKYPKNADYRMYWLTIAMNIMADRGYELVHMSDNDIVMQRPRTSPR